MALRVLHVVESLGPEAGSPAVSLSGLPDALRASGVDSETVTCDDNGADAFDQAGARRLVEQADLVHLHGWGHRLQRTVAGAAHRAGKPYVLSPLGALCNGIHNKKRWRDRLRTLLMEKRLVQRAAAVTALNEPEEFELRAGRVHPNIVPLPYGIDVTEYEGGGQSTCGSPAVQSTPEPETAVSQEGRCLLVLGPLHPVEGFIPLLKALSELGPEFDGWNVVLAGPQIGDYRKMLEAAVRRKGGEGRVLFAPASDPQAQRSWLVRASILVTPSLQIRFPVSIMQAVAVGVPVLATSCVAPAGLEDVIRVCAPTRGDLKLGLRSLLGLSDEDRAALTRRAREVGRGVFDWSVLAGRYAELYRSLI